MCHLRHLSQLQRVAVRLDEEKQKLEQKIAKCIQLKVRRPSLVREDEFVPVNSYGSENLDYVTNQYLNRLLEIPYRAVPELIKFIHFHPRHPENHNVKIPNKNKNRALVHHNGRWLYKDKRQMIDSIVENIFHLLEEHFEKTKCVLEHLHRKYFEKFQSRFEHDSSTQKKLKLDTELTILNWQASSIAQLKHT